MKTLICQLWRQHRIDKELRTKWMVISYSLHLNEMHRLHFLHKNVKQDPRLDLKEYYSCEVKDDIYKKVVQKQAKHGLMFEGAYPKETNLDGLKIALELIKDLSMKKKKVKLDKCGGKWFVWDSGTGSYEGDWDQTDPLSNP